MACDLNSPTGTQQFPASPAAGTPRQNSLPGCKIRANSPGQDAKYEAIFMIMDEDGDGRINVFELQKAVRMRGANLTLVQVQDILERADRNKDGTLNLSEFKAWMSGKSGDTAGIQPDDAEFMRLFNIFDDDKDGKISVMELYKTMRFLGMQSSFRHAQNLMEGADINGDGFLDFQEFSNVMRAALPVKEPPTSDPEAESKLRRAFAIVDENGDGRITIDELNKGLQLLGLSLSTMEVLALMREADTNNDGMLDLLEFSTVIQVS